MTISGVSLKKENILNIIKTYEYEFLQNWDLCKNQLRKLIPEPFFSHFIEPIYAFIDKEQNIILFTENEKLQKHIEIRYSEILKEIISDFYKENLKIKNILFYQQKRDYPTQTLKHKLKYAISSDIHQNQNEKNTNNIWDLDIFYPAKENYEELTKLIQVDKFFRPIYIYGKSGSGKTSLAKTWKKIHQNKVFYITIPNFINEFVLSIKRKNTITWIEKIKTHSILIFDDFQFLRPSAIKCQEEIRNLIDYSYEKNQVLVILSDRDIPYLKLEKDLYSRLLMFHKIQLHYPDYETKITLIKHYLNKYQIILPQNVIEHIAIKLMGDVRYLQSSIEKLAFSSSEPSKLRTSEIDLILQPYYDQSLNVPIEVIAEVVCNHYNISIEKILSNQKQKNVSLIRHMIAYIAVKLGNYTLSYTAKFLRKRDHTSVLYAIKKIEDLIAKDLFWKKEIEELKEKIYLSYREHQ